MPHRSRHRPYYAAAMGLALLASLVTCSPPRGSRFHMRPIAPPCNVDGVFLVDAQRTGSSGSVCNLQDLRALHGEITIQRTGPAAAQVHRKGKYSHQANVDARSCAVWTQRTPTFNRKVMGATVGGDAAYRFTVSPNGSLSGNAQLQVRSNSILVPGCSASFNVVGRRVR